MTGVLKGYFRKDNKKEKRQRQAVSFVRFWWKRTGSQRNQFTLVYLVHKLGKLVFYTNMIT